MKFFINKVKYAYKRKAFTLIELIIVIAVIAVLAGLALPKFIGVRRDANVSAMYEDIDALEKAISMYNVNSNDDSYPIEDYVIDLLTLDQTLQNELASLGDSGSQLYEIDDTLLEKYIQRTKFDKDDYIYSMESNIVISKPGKVDGDNKIHHTNRGLGVEISNENINTYNEFVGYINAPKILEDCNIHYYKEKLYIFPGKYNSNYSQEIQIYDFNTGLWSKKDNIPFKLEKIKSELIDGKIYFFGGAYVPWAGWNSASWNKTIYVYDIENDEWSSFTEKSSESRKEFDTAKYKSNIYVIGGYYTNSTSDKYINTIDVINTETETLEVIDMPTNLKNMSSEVVGNKLYIFGGEIQYFGNNTKVYILNLDTFEWEAIESDFKNTRFTTESINGKIYCIGGTSNSYKIFDTRTNTFEDIEIENKTVLGTNSTIINGNIYMINNKNSIEIYDTGLRNGNEIFANEKEEFPIENLKGKFEYKSSNFNPLANYVNTEKVFYGSQIEYYNDKLYIFSGQHDYIYSDIGYIYDLKNKTWSKTSNGAPKYERGSSTIIGDKIYFFGGASVPWTGWNSASWNKTVYIYDIKNDKWSTAKNSMPTPKRNPSTLAIGNKIYVIGGNYNNSTENTDRKDIEIFDTITETWSYGGFLPTGSTDGDAITYDGKIYYFGNSSVYVYNPSLNIWTEESTIPNNKNGITTQLIDKEVYLYSKSNTSVDIYNLETRTWRTENQTNGYSDTTIIDGRVFGLYSNTIDIIETGYSKKDNSLDEEKISIVQDNRKWTFDENDISLKEIYNYGSSINSKYMFYDDKKIYLVTSSGLMIYDQNTNDITTETFNQLYKSSYSYLDGNLYIIGGYSEIWTGSRSYYRDISVYNTKDNTKKTKTNMTKAKAETFSLVVGDYIYVFGGYYSSSSQSITYDTFDIYNTKTNTWSYGKRLPIETQYGSCALVKDKLYLASNNNLYVYDYLTNKWKIEKSDIITNTVNMIGIDNKLYYFISDTMYMYDTVSKETTTLEVLPSTIKSVSSNGSSIYIECGGLIYEYNTGYTLINN